MRQPNVVMKNAHLVVEFYGLVDHVLVALLEAQVFAPTRLDKSLCMRRTREATGNIKTSGK